MIEASYEFLPKFQRSSRPENNLSVWKWAENV